MKDFFATTVGKFVISLLFAIGALIVAQAGEFITNNPELFGGITLLVINALLFAGKNLLNPKVKNL